MTDFKAIETFMWVVTLGSFRGAAQKLNTTQPAISTAIWTAVTRPPASEAHTAGCRRR